MRVVFLAVAAALVLSASCHVSTDASATGIPGTYKLTKIDASPLPFRLATGFTVRGQLDLQKGGGYTLTQTDSATSGVSNFSSSGKWTVTDNAIQFVDGSATLQLGVAFGDSVRTTYRSHDNVYVRQ